MSRTAYIYALIDARSNKPFYVGQTLAPEKRLAAHRSVQRAVSKIGRTQNIKEAYMMWSFMETSKTVEMRILSEVDESEVLKHEQYWIQLHVKMGYEMCNSETIMYRQLSANGSTHWGYAPVFWAQVATEKANCPMDYYRAAQLWEHVAYTHSNNEYILNHAANQSHYCYQKCRNRTWFNTYDYFKKYSLTVSDKQRQIIYDELINHYQGINKLETFTALYKTPDDLDDDVILDWVETGLSQFTTNEKRRTA